MASTPSISYRFGAVEPRRVVHWLIRRATRSAGARTWLPSRSQARESSLLPGRDADFVKGARLRPRASGERTGGATPHVAAGATRIARLDGARASVRAAHRCAYRRVRHGLRRVVAARGPETVRGGIGGRAAAPPRERAAAAARRTVPSARPSKACGAGFELPCEGPIRPPRRRGSPLGGARRMSRRRALDSGRGAGMVERASAGGGRGVGVR